MTSATPAPLRVLHVLDTFEDGGAQRVALAIGGWARPRGVTSAYWGSPGPLSGQGPAGSDLYVTTRSTTGFVGRLLDLDRAVRRFGPHVLHAHQRREALLAHLVGALRRIPVVEHAHTELPAVDRRMLSFRSSKIFAVSESVARMVVEGFGRPRDRVIVTGNAPANISETPATAPDLTVEPLKVLGIGRLSDQKDPDRFLAAMETLAAHRPVSARWLGDGPLLDSLQERARRSEVVEFVGASRDVAGELDRAHLLVSTSRWEGTPLVMLEAMARRRPVAATAVGGVSELLGGGRGTLVPADASAGEIAALLDRALSDRDDLALKADRAKQWVDSVASPQAVFGLILDVYRDLGRRS